MRASDIDLEYIVALYEKYDDDLRAVREAQRRLRREWNPRAKSQLDDVEAEISYLLLRDRRPGSVIEIGSLHGWSTTWILRALTDNRYGELHSYDLRSAATENVPAELTEQRWTFTRGDVREHLVEVPTDVEYLFIDAAHTARFARWYIGHLFPSLRPGTTVSVHDVFHRRRPLPLTESSVLLHWLSQAGIGYFTAARAHAAEVADQLAVVRATHSFDDPIHTGRDDPMIFFTVDRQRSDRTREVEHARR